MRPHDATSRWSLSFCGGASTELRRHLTASGNTVYLQRYFKPHRSLRDGELSFTAVVSPDNGGGIFFGSKPGAEDRLISIAEHSGSRPPHERVGVALVLARGSGIEGVVLAPMRAQSIGARMAGASNSVMKEAYR